MAVGIVIVFIIMFAFTITVLVGLGIVTNAVFKVGECQRISKIAEVKKKIYKNSMILVNL